MFPVLIGDGWRPPSRPDGRFCAVDPRTGQPLPGDYPISSFDDLAVALESAERAAATLLAVPKGELARFLDTYARTIEERAPELAAMAARETGREAAPRFESIEIPRTADQLRQAAAAARDRSWCRPTIDSKNNLRSMHGPMGGAVVTLGPSNFPFAFNAVSGGDFAAAVAAGNPVIAKGHPGHPGTTRMLAECAQSALAATELPPGTVQLVYHLHREAGLRLAGHPLASAIAFTGGRRAGLELKAEADRAGKPIYLEMSSVNPVFVLPGALAERRTAVAAELFESCAREGGQLCTKPALSVVLGNGAGRSFVEELAQRFRERAPAVLLGERELRALSEAVQALAGQGAKLLTGGQAVDAPGYRFANTLFTVDGDTFLARAQGLQSEAFGTVHLVVLARDLEQMCAVARAIQGSLTAAIYGDTGAQDELAHRRLASILRFKVGRLLADKMPTGVAVSPAMNHGGPFPATGHPGFTAVGVPASMLRFSSLHCYDNVRPHRLPEELRDPNPTGTTWRLIDGAYTQGAVGGAGLERQVL